MNKVEEFIAEFRGDNLEIPEKDLIVESIINKYTNYT